VLTGTALFIAVVFVLAGAIKGVIGLGLQVVPMGLLVLVMRPVEAAALLVIPSLVTNTWQLVSGPALGPLLRRLWPMMAGICLGTAVVTLGGAGLSSGASGASAGLLVAVTIIAYAALGLSRFRLRLGLTQEPWAGPLAGLATGAITTATGIFVIPAVPYLAAIDLDKDELVQALGLSFLVSTIALAASLGHGGSLKADVASPAIAALAMAMVGMWLGQAIRARLDAATFRRFFFAGLLVLGLHILVRSLA
jgi:uncharacterized membrane protein YfcA